MSEQKETVTVKCGPIITHDLEIEAYTPLRDLVTDNKFLKVTKLHPNRLVFFVNKEPAK